jgi:hypothetical protein
LSMNVDNINIFTNIYETKKWGSSLNNDNYNGSSGDGSTIEFNKDNYIPNIRKFIIDNNIKKVIDLGSGDWQCSHLIYEDLNIDYNGYDAYEKICNNKRLYPQYNFTHLDFIKDKQKLENGDLCIIKDVLQHLCNTDINELLTYLIDTKKYKFIIICNCCYQHQDNIDIQNGDWRALSTTKFPLKTYNPKILFNYNQKEVSLITIVE